MEKEMFKNIEAVIFDMDGTLVDSMWMWHAIDEEYLRRFGFEMPEGLQEDIGGISIRQTAVYFKERFGIEDSIEKMIADWDDMAMAKYRFDVPLKDGVTELLDFLYEHKIRCAVATSSSNALTEAVMETHGIGEYFETIVTGEDIHNGKPAPDIYLECADRLSVAPNHCLVFEDVVHGIKAAKAAGMNVCAVEDEFSIEDTYKKKKLSDYYIRSFYEIFDETYEDFR